MIDSHILSFATGNNNAAGDVEIKAQTLDMVRSVILAHATNDNNAGDVKITLKDDNELFSWFGFSVSNPFSSARAAFTMDADSLIRGRDVKIDVTAKSGMALDFDGFNFGDNFFVGATESVLDDLIGGMFKNLNGILPVGIKSAEALIQIDGNIIATGDVELNAFASAKSKFSHTDYVVAGSLSLVDAVAQILIGTEGANNIISATGDVTMFSKAETIIDVKTKEKAGSLNIPLDIAFSFGRAESVNRIHIGENVTINAGNDIFIDALTERTHSLEVEGGSGQSYMGLVVGILIGDAQTDVIVNGALDAGNDIRVAANTKTIENSVSTMAKMKDDKGGFEWKGMAISRFTTPTRSPKLAKQLKSGLKMFLSSPTMPLNRLDIERGHSRYDCRKKPHDYKLAPQCRYYEPNHDDGRLGHRWRQGELWQYSIEVRQRYSHNLLEIE